MVFSSGWMDVMDKLATVAALQDTLTSGETTAVALAEAALARAHDPEGEGARVFVEVADDMALAMARASDALRAAGLVRSPLEGLPVSLKDVFDVPGQVTTAGSKVLRDRAPASRAAPVVERLVAAGAVLVGRTTMTEFAYSGLGLNPHCGTPRNPWDRTTGRIPGGSSSGAAVSVSDGMAAIAIGTDTGGSVRIPSALCGLTGFKPTQRRIPRDGILPLSTSLDSVGPLAPDVASCIVVDAILAGQPPVVPAPRPLNGARLLLPQSLVLDDLDEAVAQAFDAALTRLSQAGATLVRQPLEALAGYRELFAHGSLSEAESWAWHREFLAAQDEAYDPRVATRIRRGERMAAADYLDLLQARRRWIADMEAVMAGFDAMVMPTVACVAPPIAALEPPHDEAYLAANRLILRNTDTVNFLDGCALSLPCHEPGTAPVGLMLAAPGGRDAGLLALGLAVEAALRVD